MALPPSSPSAQLTASELRDLLEDALVKFGAVRLPEPSREELARFDIESRWIPYLKNEYRLYPDAQRAFLGKGGYGSAYKVKSVKNPKEPLQVVKVLIKERIRTRADQIQHFCAELGVTGFIDHPNLNHRTALFHNDTHVFFLLELCAGPRPNVLTRIAHIIAYRRPHLIPQIEQIREIWAKRAREEGVDPSNEEAFGDFVDRAQLIHRLAVECGAQKNIELPVSSDFFGLIVANRKLPDPVCQVITRQILLGLDHLHSCQIVHRDMKTENVVVGINRSAQLQKDNNGVITAVVFTEKFDVKVIDFGLVKYMNVNDAVFGQTATPNAYITASVQGQNDKNSSPAPSGSNNNNNLAPPPPASTDLGAYGGAFGGAFGGALNFGNAKPKEGGPAFSMLAVTPAMTACYAPLEAIQAVNKHGFNRKWLSTKASLPKVDIYGCATALFCASHGRPPFSKPCEGSGLTKEQQLEQQMRVGPSFSDTISPPCRAFTSKMLCQDVNLRPTAAQCLEDPFVKNVGDTVITKFYADENRRPWCRLLRDFEPQQQQQQSSSPSTTQPQQQQKPKNNNNKNNNNDEGTSEEVSTRKDEKDGDNELTDEQIKKEVADQKAILAAARKKEDEDDDFVLVEAPVEEAAKKK